ncbi:MAG: hypothetical protein ACFFCS_20705 [Candidatus Hodarchaeota archaeon]
MIREQQMENRSNLTQVNVMINNVILKDWDKWCEKKEIKRSTLIIQAVDKFLHDKSDNAEILRKFEDILQLLSKKLEIIRISSIQQDEEESLSVLDKMLNDFKKDLEAINDGSYDESIKIVDDYDNIFSYCDQCGRRLLSEKELPLNVAQNFCPDCGKELKKCTKS